MNDKTYLHFKRVLLRILKEYCIIHTNTSCYSKMLKNISNGNPCEIFAFLDRNIRDWVAFEGGYCRYYKAQLELAYILWKTCEDDGIKDDIFDYIMDFLGYIVTEEDVYEYGEEDDDESRKIRESAWYLMVKEKTF